MKAPDKIFIKPGQIKVEMIPGGELPNVGIQYIRKGAILEWAKEQKEAIEELIKEHPKDDSLWAEMHWYEQLIKHIESL